MSDTAELVCKAINATNVAEVVKLDDAPNQVRITHRVTKDRLKVWLGVVGFVLSNKDGWEAHVCKHYFMRNGKLLYAWNFIIQVAQERKEEALQQLLQLLRRAAREVKVTQYQLDSYPLAIKNKDRNAPEGDLNLRASGYSQRGAHRIGGKRK